MNLDRFPEGVFYGGIPLKVAKEEQYNMKMKIKKVQTK